MKELLIGAFLGWVLSQVSSWWKGRIENKRTLNKVLFSLLELYNLLSLANYKPILDELIRVFNDRFRKNGVEEDDILTFNTQFTDLTLTIIAKYVIKQSENINTTFNSSIEELAKILPEDAFDLTILLDKETILQFADFMEKYNQSNEKDSTLLMQKDIYQHNLSRTLPQSLAITRTSILNVAKKRNWFTWKKMETKLNNLDISNHNKGINVLTEAMAPVFDLFNDSNE